MLRYDRQTKPGLVALYNIRPGNGAGPFLQPRSPHGAGLNRDQAVQISRLSSGESFVSKRKKFIFLMPSLILSQGTDVRIGLA